MNQFEHMTKLRVDFRLTLGVKMQNLYQFAGIFKKLSLKNIK